MLRRIDEDMIYLNDISNSAAWRKFSWDMRNQKALYCIEIGCIDIDITDSLKSDNLNGIRPGSGLNTALV